MMAEIFVDVVDRVVRIGKKHNIPVTEEDAQSVGCIVIGMAMYTGEIRPKMIEDAMSKYYTMLHGLK